ncbi:MAG: PorV/PorQ family protein [candidate division KSB1 bacterium]|nr:PorV/PorQ family protein [candidate division KSB1 bacterium]
MKKSWLVAILLFRLGVTELYAFEKVATTSFQFLKVTTDARATAMGEACVAAPRGAACLFWNPGALTTINGTDLNLSYVDWLLDTRQASLALAHSLGNWGTVGLQAMMVDVGEIEVTRVEALGFVGDVYNPGLTGETMKPSAVVLGVSYARALTDKFSFGLTAKLVHEDLELESKSALAFDAGLVFDTGYRSLRLGAAIRHFGREIKYVDKSYPMPQTFTLGIAGQLLGPAHYLLFPSEDHELTLAYDLSHPRDYDQQHHLGVEYAFRRSIFLRAGYKFNYDEEGLALGFGLKASRLHVDYSYAPFSEFLGSVHRFTIGLEIR